MGARDKLVTDLQAVVADTEELLKVTATQTGEQIARIRARAEESVRVARAQLQSGARVVDGQVRANPWAAVGIAAGAGLLVGMLIARR